MSSEQSSPNRADLKGAADCMKRNKPSCAESHEHDIAHTNDFYFTISKAFIPKKLYTYWSDYGAVLSLHY